MLSGDDLMQLHRNSRRESPLEYFEGRRNWEHVEENDQKRENCFASILLLHVK